MHFVQSDEATNSNHIQLHADDVQMSDWWEATAAKDVWKSITMGNGEQFAMISSTILMLVSPATVWDSGWY